MPDRIPGDPSPRTLDSLYREVKSLEDKFNLQFAAQKEAVELLQDLADRQPTTDAINHDLAALDRLTNTQFVSLKELIKTMFEGNQIALAAALKTQEKTLDEIKSSFGKQFDGLVKTIDDLKERITTSEGRGLGSRDLIALVVAFVIIGGGIAAFFATRT